VVLRITILFFALFLLLMQKVSLEFSYWREGKEDQLVVLLRGPWGIPLYRGERNKGDGEVTEGNSRSSPFKWLSRSGRLQRPVIWSIIKSARVEDFTWKIRFGTADAALTGIVVGLCWVLIGWLVAFLQNKGWKGEPKHIELAPVFTEPCFYTSFHCIVSTRIVHLITAQLKPLMLVFRQRKR